MVRWRNTASGYGFVSASLHWVIVAGVIAQYFLAEAGEESDAPATLFDPANLHISLGLTLLALALLRLVWRLTGQTPDWPATMKRYERLLARSVHAAFYVLLFAIPLSGWALSSAEGDPVRFFGLFDVPAWVSANESSEELLEEVHEVLFNCLFALALLHAAAALKHHFFDKDNVLRGMFGRPRRPG